jgi:predicted patatin/cPLA2 family phospholipase
MAEMEARLRIELENKQKEVESLTMKLVGSLLPVEPQTGPQYEQIVNHQIAEIDRLLSVVKDKEESYSQLNERYEAVQHMVDSLTENSKFFENKLLDAERYSTDLEKAVAVYGEKLREAESHQEQIEQLKEKVKAEESAKNTLA